MTIYHIRRGSTLERSQLVKFIQRTYQELFPQQKDFAHLAITVEQYFSKDTPLWWVDFSSQESRAELGTMTRVESLNISSPLLPPTSSPVACLWMGNAIDQIKGDRHAHIFLLYVVPEHRRRGIATALMQYAENWAKQRGDRQIALQVFQSNPPAINLYNHLGYQTQSLWMVKKIN
ncbi:GCN5-related N-acetyltransferase [Trichormus variabilis ATCC 29413]|uniref:GCN5-related N-acetyltransferase n=2 Tax=Anabaena variabilis TaxID=264691 RepID=Q3MDB0_TRIV2|nr:MULTISPECIES: GNAT family N-acetyltransferase [Nostocaceae]ABA21026.1 GCN5-related N-acetyltransferase [Trichormus variabilis ATCC 29413]MBC1214176.1 GNAT family N-acetyltransferase [Trichormus variabilis ARAD]MBC1256025.1 GNAT family N-acetyltransferase [Trichormus variabilis V5]MBC1269234.1 GNAT family N-acetyltransferase [Trichormus variabilis FSR]MBC1300651.1 GNAT family N-acetyltransferase [Trichormus variabilis N2B]